MVGNFKILLLSLTLALFLAPGISQACSTKEKQVIKTATSSQTFIKQSFAQISRLATAAIAKMSAVTPNHTIVKRKDAQETVAETFAVLLNTLF